MIKPLHKEIALLNRCEVAHGLPAAPIVYQLRADAERPLPDKPPDTPEWRAFQWPSSGVLDFQRQNRTEPWNPWGKP
jgi:hypothetical protein